MTSGFGDFALADFCSPMLTDPLRQVSISDFLTLFSSRTTGFFWSSRPGNLLLGAALFSLSLSTVLACAWPATVVHPHIAVLGLARGEHRWWPLFVWIYCLVWCALHMLLCWILAL